MYVLRNVASRSSPDSSGAVDGVDALIQAAKARARGLRCVGDLITFSYVVYGKLSLSPTSPYRTTSSVSAT